MDDVLQALFMGKLDEMLSDFFLNRSSFLKWSKTDSLNGAKPNFNTFRLFLRGDIALPSSFADRGNFIINESNSSLLRC
jgi:hypothetical protein